MVHDNSGDCVGDTRALIAPSVQFESDTLLLIDQVTPVW